MINSIHSIYFLALTSGLYSGFSKFALGMWLRDYGASLLFLNLVSSWTTFPYVVSAFWMPFLENFTIPFLKFGVKKNFIIICDFVIFMMTISLPFFSKDFIVNSKIFVLSFLMTYSCIIITRDSISIGYKMEFINKENLKNHDGIISAFYQIGLLFSTAGLLKLSVFFTWKKIFILMSVVFLINFLIDFFIKDSSYNAQVVLTFFEKFSNPYRALISRNQGFLIGLFLFLVFYNLPDRMLIGNLNYYVLDVGLSKSTFANLKLFTSFVGIFMGVLTTYCTRKIGVKKMLIFSSILYGFIPASILLDLYFNLFGDYRVKILMILCLLDKVFKSFQGTSFFTYQMQFCTKEYAGTQRGLFVLLERLLCVPMSCIVGIVLKHYGYLFFFFLVSFFIIPSVLFALNLFRVTKKQVC